MYMFTDIRDINSYTAIIRDRMQYVNRANFNFKATSLNPYVCLDDCIMTQRTSTMQHHERQGRSMGRSSYLQSQRVSSSTRSTAQITRTRSEITHFSQASGNPADLTQASPVSSTLSIAKSIVSQIQEGYCESLPICPSCNHMSRLILNRGSSILYVAQIFCAWARALTNLAAWPSSSWWTTREKMRSQVNSTLVPFAVSGCLGRYF